MAIFKTEFSTYFTTVKAELGNKTEKTWNWGIKWKKTEMAIFKMEFPDFKNGKRKGLEL